MENPNSRQQEISSLEEHVAPGTNVRAYLLGYLLESVGDELWSMAIAAAREDLQIDEPLWDGTAG